MGKKILWTHNFPKISAGGGGWMYDQYNHLKEEVDLYFFDNLRNPLQFVLHFFRFRSKSKEYDLVHAQYGSAVGFLTSFAKCKKVLSLKGSDWYKAPHRGLLHKIRISIGLFLTNITLRKYDHIIVMSHAMKREVLKKFAKANITVLVDPIDLTKFTPSKIKSKKTKKKVLFASVNRDNPTKRYDLAKESIDLLKKIIDVEPVVMTGLNHNEVCEFMNSTDVILLTSTHEGWPNVVKEMLALNKPFVSTDVSDLSVIARQTQSCFVCEANAEALCKGLQKSLTAPHEELRKYVLDFSMAGFTEKLYIVYDKVLMG